MPKPEQTLFDSANVDPPSIVEEPVFKATSADETARRRRALREANDFSDLWKTQQRVRARGRTVTSDLANINPVPEDPLPPAA